MTNDGRSYLKALGKLASGSGLGYAFVLLLSPVLTRLYSPEQFGTFAVFGTLVAIASIFGSFSLEYGILDARTRSKAAMFAVASIAMALAFCTFSGLLVSLILPFDMDFALPLWSLYAAVLSCFLAVMTSTGINWCIRTDRPGIAARATFTSLASRSTLQACFGLGFGGFEGLVLGELVGRLLAWIVSGIDLFRLALNKLRTQPRRVISHVSKQKSYLFLVTPAVALETAQAWFPAALFALFYDPAAGGLIALVQRFGTAPITIANQSLGQLFHREASRPGQLKSGFVSKSVSIVIAITMPAVAVLLLILWNWGDAIASRLLGANWIEAGFVALALVPLYYAQFLSILTNRLVLISGRMHLKLYSSVVHLIILIASIAISAAANLTWETALCTMSGLLTISHIVIFSFVLHIIK